MKNILLLACTLIISIAIAYTQTPAPDPDTLREVKQTDPAPENLPSDDYTEGHVKITPEQLPERIKQMLRSDTQYEGWEKAAAYQSKTSEVFMLEITKADTTRIFQFDRLGQPVE